jgi:hypothetical protein
MTTFIDKVDKKWKSIRYFGAGAIGSQISKVFTNYSLEQHTEAALYHGGNPRKSNQNIETATIASALFSSLVGGFTGFLADGKEGIFEGAVKGGIAGAGLTIAEKTILKK